jgi:16S rRNA G966 N2-methylase RsmD
VKTNVLYYGDNLDILRRYIADESVDLIYLDPPFNSNRDYNFRMAALSQGRRATTTRSTLPNLSVVPPWPPRVDNR